MGQLLLVSLPCATTGQPQVGRFELHGESWLLMGVSRQRPGSMFRSEATAGQTGSFGIASSYLGCPSCGARQFAQCGYCTELACFEQPQQTLHCPTCGHRNTIEGFIDRVSSLGDA
jgi:hypothetical protein